MRAAYGMPVSCWSCGGRLDHVAHVAAQVPGAHTGAVVRCAACRVTYRVDVLMQVIADASTAKLDATMADRMVSA